MKVISSLTSVNYSLAVEVAECAQLIKGYADTHALGTRNFTAILESLPNIRGIQCAAEEVKKLRTAALADDTGKALAQLLEVK